MIGSLSEADGPRVQICFVKHLFPGSKIDFDIQHMLVVLLALDNPFSLNETLKASQRRDKLQGLGVRLHRVLHNRCSE